MAETELERAEKRFAQAKARLQGLRNREATRQRKLDTRRKVILGGALIDLTGRDDRAVEMLERLMRNLVREQDRAAFDGWDWRADAGSDVGGDAAKAGEAESAPEMESASDEGAGQDGAGTDGARTLDAAGAAQEPMSESTPRLQLRVPSNPNLHKEFLARRRASFSEE